MAINVPGEIFVSKGIKYVLANGPNGNLRPYTVGPVKKAIKTRNPYIIASTLLVVASVAIGIGIWRYCKKN